MDTQKDKHTTDEDKVLPVPDSQLEGSDADKAYDENGEFGESTKDKDEEQSNTPEGSDADG
ncbi:hypothetical protein ASE74_13425 [Pedobacter sp. Leaf216]|uniref:hypothetical protein n=1 Tax=Pedobacter sp. Leaf216 TaxID=1735684 RepID=UPI0006FAE9CC|nr:hypothetical protein [Pedobacter sp. Leaf216]KQM78499.1 hypothetical protein ASE74_13425 [Pedobacter sp. Leaf216]